MVLTCRGIPEDIFGGDVLVRQVDGTQTSLADSSNPSVQVRVISEMSGWEVSKLLSQATGRQTSSALLDWVVSHTGGNPQLVNLLVECLLSDGRLRESHMGLALKPDLDAACQSERLEHLLRSRVDTLPADARGLAEVVSAGPGVTPGVLASITGLLPSRVEHLVARLKRDGLMRCSAVLGELEISGELLRLTIYSGVSDQTKKSLHDGIVAAWQQSAGGSDPLGGRSDEVIAWHCYRGSSPSAAVPHALAALVRLTASGKAEESVPYLRMLEDLTARTLSPELLPARVLMEVALSYWRMGRASSCADACALGLRSLACAPDSDTPARLDFAVLEAKALVLGGDLETAARILEEALPQAQESSCLESFPKALYTLCMVQQMSGQFREMENTAERCLAEAERSGRPDSIRLACVAKGNALMALCRWEEATMWYQQAGDRQKHDGEQRGLATTYGNLGRAHLHLGEWEQADEFFEQSITTARDIGCSYTMALSLANSALLWTRRGVVNEAARRFRESVAHGEVSGDSCGLAATLSDYGELEHIRGNDHAALELLARSEALMNEAGGVDDLPELKRRRAECLVALGEPEEAAQLVSEALDMVTAMGNRLEESSCLRVLGELRASAGDLESAEEHLRKAEDITRELGAPYELGQVLSSLGRALLLKGSSDSGLQALAEARDTFVRLGARRDARFLQEEISAASGQTTPLEGRLPDEREHLAALYRSSQSLSSSQSADILARELADIAAATIPADTAGVVLFGADGRQSVVMSSLCGFTGKEEDVVSIVSSLMPSCEDGEPCVITEGDAAPPGVAPLLRARKAQRLALVPLASGRRALGALYLEFTKGSRIPSQEDVRFLRALAVQAATFIENARLRSKLEDEVESLRWVVDGRHKFANIVGQSLSMQHLFSLLEKVARTSVTVLIEGESGTGKELVARAIHLNGARRDARFVAQNCAALPEQLLESELFGHVRGAFTGAHRDKPGLFEAADGGTFFLDEIADMPPSLQVKLLRVLQDGEIRRVGATEPVAVDVRIIAATNRSLREEVAAGRFREDLFYRLDVVRVQMPSLRDRRDDIPLLAQHFLNRECEAAGESTRGFSDRAMDLLVNYDWPGNVRELENEIQRAVALSDPGTTITSDCLSERIRTVQIAIHPPKPGTRLALKDMVEDVEKRVILQVLNENKWNKSRTADALGLSRQGLLKKIARFGLEPDSE